MTVDLMVIGVISVKKKNAQVMIYLVLDMDPASLAQESANVTLDGLGLGVTLPNVKMTVAMLVLVWSLIHLYVIVVQVTLELTAAAFALMVK